MADVTVIRAFFPYRNPPLDKSDVRNLVKKFGKSLHHGEKDCKLGEKREGKGKLTGKGEKDVLAFYGKVIYNNTRCCVDTKSRHIIYV